MQKTESKVSWAFKKIFLGVASGLIVFFLFMLLLNIIFPSSNYEISLDTERGMSSKQRLSDFKDMTDFMEEHIPFIYDYEELYGISFEDMKSYYTGLVGNAESDYEYYCLIQGFINNIPSGHMTMGYPNEDYIPMLYQQRTSDYPQFGQACGYWESVLQNECRKYYDKDYSVHAFYYLNGEYFESEYTNSENNIPYSGAKLLSVNGVPADEFIKLCPLTSKLNYDFQNGKPFREILIFNNISGEECTVEYETESGKVVSENAFYGTSAVVSNYIEYFRSIDRPEENENEEVPEIDESDIPNIYSFIDEERDVLYLKFNDFSQGGAEALKFFRENELPDNIIIDLRENGGGMDGVCHSLIEELSAKSFEYSTAVYVTPEENEYLDYPAKKAGELSFETKFKKLCEDIREEKFEGKSEREYNIYVLVSKNSISASDKFAAIIKDNDIGTVIGAFGTGGEAYGSPDIRVQTSSGLYFYYTPFKSLNRDGTDNSVYGTSPDIYVTLDKDFLKNRDELFLRDEPYGTYENRLKWDSVLIRALEEIKKQ